MNRNDLDDRFVDMLLCEKLKGEVPPDLLPGVLGRCASSQRRIRIFHLTSALAAAAVILLALGIWHFPAQYPAPRAEGAFIVEGGGPVQHGSTLRTTDEKANLCLGGYAMIEIAPRSVLAIIGNRNAEGVMLEQGKVYCEVESGKGRSFDVRTGLGTVSVLGTKFTVQVKEDEMKVREMVVKVIVGMVLVTTAGGETSLLQAGETSTKRIRMMPDNGGNLPGIMTSGIRNIRKMFPGREGEEADLKETDAQKALRSLQIQRMALRELKRKIEKQVLLEPEVMELMNKSQKLEAEYKRKLEENPQFKILKEEKKRLQEQMHDFYMNMRNLDREERKAKYREVREIRKQIRENEEQQEDFPQTIPELANLQQECRKAAIAYLDKVEDKLNANPEYVKLHAQLEKLDMVLREKQRRAMPRIHRNVQWGGGRHMGMTRRFKPNRKEGQPKAAVKKQEPVQTF